MAKLQLDIELVTPLFLGGANSRGDPELRASPIRGVLRYWLRAAIGARGVIDKDSLSEAESRVFGDTKAGSSIVVRVSGVNGQKLAQGRRRVLPHSTRKTFRDSAFSEGEQIRLSLDTRPGRLDFPEDLLKASLLWLNLGGLGKRARRGFGSMRLVGMKVSGLDLPDDFPTAFRSPKLPTDGAALAKDVREAVDWALKNARKSDNRPPFPAFLQGQSKVLVCKWAFPSGIPPYEPAMKAFWDQLRSEGLLDNHAYGYAGGDGRRASPVHLHIDRSEKGYHLILTAFYSEPSPKGDAGWDKVTRLLDSAKGWDGEYVWGDEE